MEYPKEVVTRAIEVATKEFEQRLLLLESEKDACLSERLFRKLDNKIQHLIAHERVWIAFRARELARRHTYV